MFIHWHISSYMVLAILNTESMYRNAYKGWMHPSALGCTSINDNSELNKKSQNTYLGERKHGTGVGCCVDTCCLLKSLSAYLWGG